jgi:hypothetical protein
MASLILIDRTRVLINEKLNIFKEDYKLLAKTKKSNERKSGSIFEEKLKEEMKRLKKLEMENQMEKNKVNNLKKSPLRQRGDALSPNKTTNSQSMSQFNEIDNDEDEFKHLDANKVVEQKIKIEDINSDLDNQSVKSEVSDCTSMTSNNSVTSFKEEVNLKPADFSGNSISVKQNDKKEFIKMALKIKFEKLHNTHKGQQVSEKALYEECLKQGIAKSKWGEFILQELNTPGKYALPRKSLKKTQGQISRAYLR